MAGADWITNPGSASTTEEPKKHDWITEPTSAAPKGKVKAADWVTKPTESPEPAAGAPPADTDYLNRAGQAVQGSLLNKVAGGVAGVAADIVSSVPGGAPLEHAMQRGMKSAEEFATETLPERIAGPHRATNEFTGKETGPVRSGDFPGSEYLTAAAGLLPGFAPTPTNVVMGAAAGAAGSAASRLPWLKPMLSAGQKELAAEARAVPRAEAGQAVERLGLPTVPPEEFVQRAQAELGEAPLPDIRNAPPQLALPEPNAPTEQAGRPMTYGQRVKASSLPPEFNALAERADEIARDMMVNNMTIEGLKSKRSIPQQVDEYGFIKTPIRNEYAVPQAQKGTQVWRLERINDALKKELDTIDEIFNQADIAETQPGSPAFALNQPPAPGMVGPRGTVQRVAGYEPPGVPAEVRPPELPPETEFTGGERPIMPWEPKPEEAVKPEPKPGEAAIPDWLMSNAVKEHASVQPEYVEQTVKALERPENIKGPGAAFLRNITDRMVAMKKMGLSGLQNALMDSHNVAAVIRDEANIPVAEAMGKAGAVEGTMESKLVHRVQTGTASPAEMEMAAQRPEIMDAVKELRGGYAKLAQKLNETIHTKLVPDDFYAPRVAIQKISEAMHLTPEETVKWLQERGAGEPSFLKPRVAEEPIGPVVEDAAKLWNWYVNAASRLAARQSPLKLLRQAIEKIEGHRQVVGYPMRQEKIVGGWVNDENLSPAKRAELSQAAKYLNKLEKAELHAPTDFETELGEVGQRTGKAIQAGIDAATGGKATGKVKEIRDWAEELGSGGTLAQGGIGRRIGGGIRGMSATGRFGLSVVSAKLHMTGKLLKMEAMLGPLMTGKNLGAVIKGLENPAAAEWFEKMGLDREVGAGRSEGVDISGAGKVSKTLSNIQDASMLHFKYTEAALNRVAWGAAWDKTAGTAWMGDRAHAFAAKELYNQAVSRYNPSAEPLLFNGEFAKLGFQGMRTATRQFASLLLDSNWQQKLNFAMGLGAYYAAKRMTGESKRETLKDVAHQAYPFQPRGLVPEALELARHPSWAGAARLAGKTSGVSVLNTAFQQGKTALKWLDKHL